MTLRTSPQRSTAPTRTASVSFCWRDRTPISRAFKPDAASLDTTKLGPPKRNSLAILLAIIPPRAPRVRVAVRGGRYASLSDSSQRAVFSSSSRSKPVLFLFFHSLTELCRFHRRWKSVASKSKSMPMKAPMRGRSFLSGSFASSMALPETFSINRCWRSISGISLGGM